VSFKCFSAFDRRSFPFSIKEWMKRVMKLVASLLLIFKCVYYSRSVVRVLSARSVNRRTVTSLSHEEKSSARVNTSSRAEKSEEKISLFHEEHRNPNLRETFKVPQIPRRRFPVCVCTLYTFRTTNEQLLLSGLVPFQTMRCSKTLLADIALENGFFSFCV